MALPPSPPPERTAAFWARTVEDPGAAIRELYAELGPVYRVETPGGRHITVATGAEAADRVLVRDHTRLRLRGAFPYLKEIAPDCLLAQDGEHAMRLRRLLAPALRKDRIDRYVPIMVEETDRALASWPLGEPIELAERMRELTLQVALRAFLALDVRDEHAQRIGRTIPVISEYATPLPRAWKDELRPAFLAAREEFFAFVDEAIVARRASNEDFGDILSALVHARDEDGSALDEQELRENVWALIFAAHDTTAHALAWALLLLAEDDAVRAEVIDELRRELDDAAPTPEKLSRLELLDRVCRETLRLYPSAPSIPRVAPDGYDIGGYEVPAGELLICPVFLTQRLPEHFEEPDEFRPDRWSDRSPVKGSYTPFGIGPRWCPGMPFALLEMKEVLAQVLRRFELELEPGQEIVAYATAPTMRPKPGIWGRVTAAT